MSDSSASSFKLFSKSANFILLVTFVFLVLAITNVLAIKCYQCKEPDIRCRDHFQNDTLFFKPCPLNATKCRKYKWEIGDGRTYFERGCAVHGEVSRREGRNCIERVGNYKTRMWYCICDNKDGCNAGSRQQFASFMPGSTTKWRVYSLAAALALISFGRHSFSRM